VLPLLGVDGRARAAVAPLGRSAGMLRWLRDKVTWIVLFAAIAAASSSYSAYKIYLMTDGKPAPTKGKR